MLQLRDNATSCGFGLFSVAASPKTFRHDGERCDQIIQQKISDAEQAGVREVPLLNLRTLIDQIEQDILRDHAKTPHRIVFSQ